MLEANGDLSRALGARRRRWLVTGAAGFIGSHLTESLLRQGQIVRGLDNFATGHRRNLEDARLAVGDDGWSRFEFLEGDIRDRDVCAEAVANVDIILHQAALGSVPRSLADPLTTHDVNVTGFLNMLDAAKRAEIGTFIYAASSSTYGDEPSLPKIEDRIGAPLSPYAVSKLANELYAAIYARAFNIRTVGLRYFNVFGSRQDPEGAYAAVIPKWIAAIVAGEPVTINGDGETSRDFCYIANVVQANLRAALLPEKLGGAEVFNVAVGERASLDRLFTLLREGLDRLGVGYHLEPMHGPFRAGDVRHSLASIDKARALLGYEPSHALEAGLTEALPWYLQSLSGRP